MRALAQQPGGKFTPAVQATRKRDVEIPGGQDPAEILVCPRLDPQSFQSRTPTIRSQYLQKEALSRIGRVASVGGALSDQNS